MNNAAKLYPYNTPVNKEAYYYRMIFERLFPQVTAGSAWRRQFLTLLLLVATICDGLLMSGALTGDAGLGEGDGAVGPEHRVQHARGHRVGGAVEGLQRPFRPLLLDL